MKRCLCLLLAIAVMAMTAAGSSARPFVTDDGAISQLLSKVQATGDDADRERKLATPERNGLGEGKQRKGIGAEFWGGPYWGYGPRWGHPCETCRAECEAASDGARCERCRMRCGW